MRPFNRHSLQLSALWSAGARLLHLNFRRQHACEIYWRWIARWFQHRYREHNACSQLKPNSMTFIFFFLNSNGTHKFRWRWTKIIEKAKLHFRYDVKVVGIRNPFQLCRPPFLHRPKYISRARNMSGSIGRSVRALSLQSVIHISKMITQSIIIHKSSQRLHLQHTNWRTAITKRSHIEYHVPGSAFQCVRYQIRLL